MVIEINVHGISLAQLTRYVRSKCAEYGPVKSISIHLFPASTSGDLPFAIVEMATPESTSALRDAIGDGYFANGVSIHMVHKAK